MSDLAIYEKQSLTAQDIQAQVQLIQHVMATVMKPEVHYGIIPGCGDKPALFKPGAEKILATFRLSANPEIEDLSTSDEIRYRIKTEIQSATGIVIGYGVGECSSNEDKYKWRASVCDEEFDEIPPDRRRRKWKKGWNDKPSTQTKQVRTQVADIANTVLKMAKKRSLVDACLTTTACSDIFAQDIEDMQGAMDFGSKPAGKPAVKKTERKSAQKDKPDPAAPTSEEVITVKDVTVKETKKNPKYTIVSGDDIYYGTFDKDNAAAAKAIKGSSSEAVVLFTSHEKWGHTLLDFKDGGFLVVDNLSDSNDELPTEFPDEGREPGQEG